MANLVIFAKQYLLVGKNILLVKKIHGNYHIFFTFYMIYHLDFSIFFFWNLSIRHCQCHKIKFFRQLLHPTNRINRHQNDRCQSTSVILESATVGDKGSTTLGVRNSACVVRFVEPVLTKSTAMFDLLAIPAKLVSESGNWNGKIR